MDDEVSQPPVAPAAEQDVEFDQAKIDEMLGLSSAATFEMTSGVRAIIDSALISHERLPMLEVVFDRMIRLLTASLRNLTSDQVDVTLASFTSIRFGDYLNTIPLPALLGIVKADPWDNYAMLTVDTGLSYTMVDVLLGNKGSKPAPVEGRPYSTIERGIIENVMKLFLEDLRQAFGSLLPVKFSLERMETNPRFVVISRAGNAAILAKLKVDVDNKGGLIDVLLPYATLEPIHHLLRQSFLGEKFGRDPLWEEHLAQEIMSAEIEISAVLDQSMPLRDIMSLAVGDTINLDIKPSMPVTLKCQNISVSQGKLGRVRENLAIRLQSPISAFHE